MNHKFAPKRDANHHRIVDAFESLGYSVQDVSMVPKFVDLIVARSGRSHLIEVKRDDKRTSPSRMQKTSDLAAWWKAPVYVVRTQADVVTLSLQLKDNR
jgi:hypothetical protein